MFRLPAAVTRAAGLLVETVAPPRCIGCLCEGSWHCQECQASWRPQTLSCVVCKTSQREGRTCRGCREETPLYGLVSAGSYQSDRIRRGVHWLKFKSVMGVAEPLAWLVLSQTRHIAPLPRLQQSGVLVPIPLHARREHQRGFNQAAALADALGELLSMPVANVLRRTRHTYRQTALPAAMRADNVTGAFSLVPETAAEIAEKTFVILVDDVTTSGSTLSAAAQALSSISSQQVWGLVIARG